MNADRARLERWLVRARPPRRALGRAFLTSLVAAVTGAGLFVGAVALLVVSAQRPGLRAVAGVLIVIELLAFLRSPLRFAERISAHRLGFSAVGQWRRWLMGSIGRWDFSRWRRYASGDLLERSLGDTEELQDLWLRGVLPLLSTVGTLVIGDLVIALLPGGAWWIDAVLVAFLQGAGLAALVIEFTPLVRADRRVRVARGAYRAALVELSAVAPEMSLLGAEEFLQRRSDAGVARLRDAEHALARRRRATLLVVVAPPLLGLGVLALGRPSSSPTWTVVAALIVFSSYESFAALRTALDTVVAVSAAAERLEELDVAPSRGVDPWPDEATLRVEGLTLVEDGRPLVEGASFSVAPGSRVALVGASGIGKSTLLRALAGLDAPTAGTLCVGDTALANIDERQVRRHLIYLASEPGLTRGFARDVVGLGRRGPRDATADLASLGLVVEDTTRWDELSRGERQRIALVRALVTAPEVLLLDEPTSGLGAREVGAVLALLASSGASVVVATHDERVMAWCDRVLRLANGVLEGATR